MADMAKKRRDTRGPRHRERKRCNGYGRGGARLVPRKPTRVAQAKRAAGAKRMAEAPCAAENERKAKAEREAEAARVAEHERKAAAERKAEAARAAEHERKATAERQASAARAAENERQSKARVEEMREFLSGRRIGPAEAMQLGRDFGLSRDEAFQLALSW